MASLKTAVSILGSTGSIGRNALCIVDENPQRFEVIGLSGGKNLGLIYRQVLRYKPAYVSMKDASDAQRLWDMLKGPLKGQMPEIFHGEEGAVRLATLPEAGTVLCATGGSAALRSTYEAVRAGKRIALANKESVVMAGRMIMDEAKRSGAEILPVDSEHSAIFQSMLGHRRSDIKRLILTASGGPFFGKPQSFLRKVTLKQALNHPTWDMGAKITIDSATLMNKALEIIEARWLFDIPPDRISVMIHPQSIVHSIVEYRDGSMIAQMGVPDMRIPISYALVYPERLSIRQTSLNLEQIKKLTFERPRHAQFPTIRMAYRALEAGDSMCTVLNAANEAAVKAFMSGKIRFLDIQRLIAGVVKMHKPFSFSSIEDAKEIHEGYTKITERLVSRI